MTLPSSGPLSLSAIQTEFGGSNPISLSEYYAGGAYVPSGTTGTNGAVPTSGAISIWNFYGTSAALETQTVTVGNYFDIDPMFGFITNIWGFTTFASTGSVSPGSSTIYSGKTWVTLDWYNTTGDNNGTGNVILQLSSPGLPVANSGWTTVTINGTAFARTSFTYGTSGSGPSTTTWSSTSLVSRPFTATIGAINLVAFS